jgi:NAD(P)-dependent dehydrogenase (short-subunit alcohol dehydrogenase family)
MNFQNKVAIITGSGRGIGRAVAVEFARNGASVVCCARTQESIQETADLIRKEGGQCLAVPVDVTDKQQVQNLADRTLARFGRIDVLFNNAARIPVINGVWEVDADEWWDEITVNLRGPMLCCRAVLPQMMKQNEGAIINMTGGTEIPGRTSYCCSKAALNRLTVLLAKELESVKSPVTVFAMGPGLVKTVRTLHEAESEQGRRWNPNTRSAFEQGKDRPPEDCARAAVKLLAKPPSELNGKTFAAADYI